MKKLLRSTAFSAAAFVFLSLTPVLPQDSTDYLLKYYNSYKTGRMQNASEILFNSLMTEDSLPVFYAGLMEMVSVFPASSDITELEKMIISLRTGSTMSLYRDAVNFMDNVLAGICLIKGDFARAEELKKESGWIEYYSTAGPFAYRDISDFENMNTDFLGKKSFLNSRDLQSGWYKTRSGRDGEVDFNSLFRRSAQEIYFAGFNVSVPAEEKYIIYISKTGPFEMFIDGKKVFSDYSLHKSFPGQYVVEVELQPGDHSFLSKLSGNGENETSFGIQVKNENSEPAEITAYDAKTSAAQPENFRQYFGYGIDPQKIPETETELMAAGIILQTLDYQNNDITASYFLNRIPTSSGYYSFAQTLCAMVENSPEKGDYYLRNAIKADPSNQAARYQLFHMLLMNGFFYETEPLMKEINAADRNSGFALSSSFLFYEEKEWYDKAYEKLDELRKYSGIPDALVHEAIIEKKNRNYARLVEIYKALSGFNRYSSDYAQAELQYMSYVSSPSEITEAAGAYSSIFYNHTVFGHIAAESLLNDNSGNRALMYLSASQQKCAYNSYTDYYFSKAYELLGIPEVSRYYLKRAAVMNPSETYLNEYYNFVNRNNDPLKKYKDAPDFKALSAAADGYENEPAVTLFDENIEKVMSDGSVLKSVRKAYKVFNPDNVKPLMTQNFVFSPSDDEILSVSCSVETAGETAHVNNMRYQELSSPESRLYYDSTAAVIQIPELQKGSVIYFNYLIHTKASAEYRGYYSSAKRFDNRYRILRAVNRISVPPSMQLSYQLKNVDRKNFKKVSAGNEIIYSFTDDNIASYIQEQKMVPYSERVPSVCFSSFKNWKDMHQWYRQLFEKQIVMSEQMKTDIDAAVANSKTDEEKVEAAYRYITDRIRYVGYEIGIGGIKPRRTDIVYQTRMGDCKDIALLLAAVLRYLGMDASISLVATADSGFTDENFASISNFNHAVCSVNLAGTGRIFLDGTVKQAGPRELVSSDLGTVSLVLDEKSFRFVKIENSYYYPYREADRDTVVIYDNGNASISKSAVKTNDSAIRYRMMKEGNVNIETRISRTWNSVFPASTVSKFEFKSLAVNKPVEYSYAVDVKNFSELVGNEMFIPVVSFKYEFLQTYGIAPERKGEIYIPETVSYENSFVYVIPEKYIISSIPEARELSFGQNSVVFRVTADRNDPRKILIDYNIHFERGVINPAEYKKFRQYILEIEKIETLKIILKKEADSI